MAERENQRRAQQADLVSQMSAASITLLGPRSAIVEGPTLHGLGDEHIAPAAQTNRPEHLFEQLTGCAAAGLTGRIIGFARLLTDDHPGGLQRSAAKDRPGSRCGARATRTGIDCLAQAGPGRQGRRRFDLVWLTLITDRPDRKRGRRPSDRQVVTHRGDLTAVVKAAVEGNGVQEGNGLQRVTPHATEYGLQPLVVNVKRNKVTQLLQRDPAPVLYADEFTDKASNANEYELAFRDFIAQADSIGDKGIEGSRVRKSQWTTHANVHPVPPPPADGTTALQGFRPGDAEEYRRTHPEQFLIPSFLQCSTEDLHARIEKLKKQSLPQPFQVTELVDKGTVGAGGKKK